MTVTAAKVIGAEGELQPAEKLVAAGSIMDRSANGHTAAASSPAPADA